MGGLVVDAWLAPIFVAPGSGAFSGGGWFGLADGYNKNVRSAATGN